MILGTFSHPRLMALTWRSPFDVFLSTATNSICYGLAVVSFTPAESRIVCLLAVGGIVSINSLIDFIYGEDESGGPLGASNCVFVFMRRIRAKLLESMPLITITVVYKMGYRLVVAPPYRLVGVDM
jgi:DNA-binding response OmpR family regulator